MSKRNGDQLVADFAQFVAEVSGYDWSRDEVEQVVIADIAMSGRELPAYLSNFTTLGFFAQWELLDKPRFWEVFKGFVDGGEYSEERLPELVKEIARYAKVVEVGADKLAVGGMRLK